MTGLARKLVEKGAAYEKLRSLYFDIARFKPYGGFPGPIRPRSGWAKPLTWIFTKRKTPGISPYSKGRPWPS